MVVLWRKRCFRRKTIGIVLHIPSVCVAFVTQHAMRVRRIILAFAASASTIFFPYYLINGTTFGGGGVIEQTMCVLIFSTTFVSKISHSEKYSARFYHKYT